MDMYFILGKRYKLLRNPVYILAVHARQRTHGWPEKIKCVRRGTGLMSGNNPADSVITYKAEKDL